MKLYKLFAASLMLASSVSFAQVANNQEQKQETVSRSEAGANNAGNSQKVVVEGTSAEGLRLQGSDAASIQAQAATRIAEIQAASAAAKDLSADQRAALDRDTAARIAAIQAETARAVAGTTQVLKNTPNVSGPALTSSNDTCMGSTSGSVNVPGLGIGMGSTWVDPNCKMLKNAREMWNMGMHAASIALMCNDPDNREALEITGFECPQTTRARGGNMALQASVRAEQQQYTDPIVRARLGLAPLPK